MTASITTAPDRTGAMYHILTVRWGDGNVALMCNIGTLEDIEREQAPEGPRS